MTGFPGKAEVQEERSADVPGDVLQHDDLLIEARIPLFCVWHGHPPWWYMPTEHAEQYEGGFNFFTPDVRDRILEGVGFVILLTAALRIAGRW